VTTTEDGGDPICRACGHASAAGTRFCTRCGAAVADVEPPAEQVATAESRQPDPAPPGGPAGDVQPQPQPQSRWALDTPPANEPWWRNPIVVAMAAVSIVFGGGVASWRFFISAGGDTVQVVRALPSADQSGSSPEPAATTRPTTDTAVSVRAIGRLLQESATGRAAALNEHDYRAALRNRRQLLTELDRVQVPAQENQLGRADAILRAALAASARADEGHLACGCAAELSADRTASQLKQRFAILFDPYARRYLGGPVDPGRI
jgi:hypothetical protein